MMKVGAQRDIYCLCYSLITPFLYWRLYKGEYIINNVSSPFSTNVFTYTGATVSIVSSDYMVDESQSSVEVCVNLTDIPAGGLECEVIATISTSDGPKASMSLVPQIHK